MKITIGHLYPDLLNLYGDRGNIQCLIADDTITVHCNGAGVGLRLRPYRLSWMIK